MRTRATLAVRLVTRLTRVTRVDIPKTKPVQTQEWNHIKMHLKKSEAYYGVDYR